MTADCHPRLADHFMPELTDRPHETYGAGGRSPRTPGDRIGCIRGSIRDTPGTQLGTKELEPRQSGPPKPPGHKGTPDAGIEEQEVLEGPQVETLGASKEPTAGQPVSPGAEIEAFVGSPEDPGGVGEGGAFARGVLEAYGRISIHHTLLDHQELNPGVLEVPMTEEEAPVAGDGVGGGGVVWWEVVRVGDEVGRGCGWWGEAEGGAGSGARG